MTLKSAFEDVIGTTLAAVTGTVGKLDYVSRLRSQAGDGYAHWGLARVHGEAPTQKALAESHRLLFLKLLRTPLRDLREDVEISSAGVQVTPEQYAENLRRQAAELLPADLGGGSARHFSSVLRALSSLTKNRRRATPRA
jgi:hypothetical protein